MSDQFCLKWNNHHTTLVAVFDKLFECESLVDCTVAAEGKFVKAHKVVLSACSSYLEELLQNHDDKHPILIFNDISYVELKAMLEYMYRGEVNVSQDQLNTFLKAAEALRIKGLTTDQGGGDGGGGELNDLKKKMPRKEPRTNSPVLGTTPVERPPSPKRKRRMSSRDENYANDSNSCDTAPTPPPASGHNAVTKLEEKLSRLKRDGGSAESTNLQSGTTPSGTPVHKLLQPKTEFIEEPSNAEDVSLEDEEDYGPNPGTSQASFSSQDFNNWQLGEATGDEVFMAGQHDLNNTAGNSQAGSWKSPRKRVPSFKFREVESSAGSSSAFNPKNPAFSARTLPAKSGSPGSQGSGNWCVCGKSYSRIYDLIRHMKTVCPVAKRENVVFSPLKAASAKSIKSEDTEDRPSGTRAGNVVVHQTLQKRNPVGKSRVVRARGAASRLGPKTAARAKSAAKRLGPKTSARAKNRGRAQIGKKAIKTRWGKMVGPPWVCSCGSKFKSPSGFYRHKRSLCVSEDSVSTCDGVASTSQRTQAVVFERQHTTPRAPVKSNQALNSECLCRVTFASEKSLYKHASRCSSVVDLCPCGKQFCSRGNFLRHLRDIHNTSVVAKRGPPHRQGTRKVKRKKFLGAASVQNRLAFRCMCGENFETELKLVSHIRFVCGLDLSCPLCSQQHSQKPELYAHMVKAHNLKPETVYPFRPEDFERINNHPSLPAPYRKAALF